METLNVVITEILLCLAVAWVLGFLAAWILFRKVQNEYEQEIEELEDNLSYAVASNKNQEREITSQNLKIQEFEKTLGQDADNINKKDTTLQKEGSEKDTQEKELLRRIEDNLYSPKKKEL